MRRTSTRRSLLAYGAAAFLASQPALALASSHKDKGKPESAGGGKPGTSDEELILRGAEILTEAFLTDGERRIIRDAFNGGYPEGFKKPKPIPPGIKKKLARGGTLPPGIAKTRMPDSLLSRLPRRDGQELLFIDRDVYLIQKSTELILDVMENVF